MASFAIDVEGDNYNEQNKANEDLQFQDIPHSQEKGKVQTHTFTNFPHSADSDDEAGDKTELLNQDEKGAPSFWKFGYYQQFFDVDTNQVFYRALGSMTPRPGKNFLTTQIRPNPDLYGPFWICTTLVFTTAIAGNLANYLQAAGKDYVWKYDFHKVTFAATAIFSYWWLLPAAIFGVLWWRNSQTRYTFFELLSVYGYSLAIYIPISILWTIQINWLQWILVIIGAALSGTVLVFTFWPAVREDNKRIAIGVMAVILIFHAALAAGFVLYFFHVPSPSTSTLNPAKNSTEIPEIQKIAKSSQAAPQQIANNEKKSAPPRFNNNPVQDPAGQQPANKIPQPHNNNKLPNQGPQQQPAKQQTNQAQPQGNGLPNQKSQAQKDSPIKRTIKHLTNRKLNEKK